ncbi:SH3 domain-containing protein [Saccharopolyspora rhizosphaerae]|uniref:SH3 domain-containing protein n=1 Tax=Saccharopolyspora rhizosphaerae TaxID=2492662 RepID=A0A426JI19_9PSEU|nr:SH3 domain-containing protein [Saccharopolyspora rhizosphaerae]RRO12838.1 SH3 domain-containing protein [Saccharopolyspora rhizosphaerae]
MFLIPRPLLLAGAGLVAIVYAAGSGQDSGATKPADCTFEVSADVLNVRSDPEEGATRVGHLTAGEQVEATPNVIGRFRELRSGNWAATEFLTPVPGSACAP